MTLYPRQYSKLIVRRLWQEPLWRKRNRIVRSLNVCKRQTDSKI